MIGSRQDARRADHGSGTGGAAGRGGAGDARPAGQAERGQQRHVGPAAASSSASSTPTMSLRCVILAGAGERAFRVGADIASSRRIAARSSRPAATRAHPRPHRRDRSLPPSGDRRDPRPLRRRRPRACDLLRPADRRRGRPLRHPGQAPGPCRGLFASCEPLVELVGPANALEILLEGQVYGRCGRYAWGSSIAWCRTTQVAAEVAATAAASAEGAPLVARWHKKFTRRLLQPEPLTARPRSTRASTASAPRTFAPATRPSSPRPSPPSAVASMAPAIPDALAVTPP